MSSKQVVDLTRALTFGASTVLAVGSFGADRPWVSDEEKSSTYASYCDIEFIKGTPEEDASRFWLDKAKTKHIDINYDEAKAGELDKDYTLPDLFTFLDGRKVKTPADWRERRKEILGLFERELYGVLPPKPETMEFELLDEKLSEDRFSVRRTYRQWFRKDRSGPCIDWFVMLPNKIAGKVPVILHLNYKGNDWVARGKTNHYELPLGTMAARGYAFMSAYYKQVTADPKTSEEFEHVYDGVYELWGHRDPKRTDNTGTLMAWAWALLRGLDLAETIPEVDAKRNVMIGSSRLGKAALLAGAYDERVAVTVPNQTGAVGVQIMRRNYGETLEVQKLMFPHWYCGATWKYSGHPERQPFDQHMLLACVAPRALLLECYHKKWFDPRGEWLSAKAASPVWEFLTGKGLNANTWPAPYDETFVRPPFGYVRRTECHGLSPYDWKWAMDFADQAFKRMDVQENELQAQIDAAAAAGGGTVVVPSGEHKLKPIELKSGVTLQIEKGAVLKASTNICEYPVCDGSPVLIGAYDATNVAVVGEGVIDGQGQSFKDREGLTGESQPVAVPVLMRFSRCRDVRLEDFTFRQAAAWGIHLRNSDGVTVRRVKAFSHINNSNDGIDVESRNVLIEDCELDTDDDALVFKSESDPSFAITNVHVRNCTFASCCNFIKFGTGSYGVWKDICVENCRLRRAGASWRFDWRKQIPGVVEPITGLAAIALEVVDGGQMENVTVRDISWKGGVQTPIFIRLDRRHGPPAGRGTFFRNVLVENIRGNAESRLACSATGVPGLNLSGVTLRNIDLEFPGGGTRGEAEAAVPESVGEYPDSYMFGFGALPAWGFFIRHVDDLVFENVRLRRKAPDERQMIVRDDANGFLIKE